MSPRFYSILAVLCALAVACFVLWTASRNVVQEQPLVPTQSKPKEDEERRASAFQPPDFMKRMLNGDFTKLTEEQIEHYVESRGRDALSLIVASFLSASGEKWREEVAERFPYDPQVAAMMLIARRGPEAADWAARLKENAPGNSLGYLFAAKSALDGKDLHGALKELTALETTHLDDYYGSWQSGITDAYQSAGFRGLEAEWLGRWQVPMATGEMSGLNAGIAEAMSTALEQNDRSLSESLGRFGMKASALVGGRGDRDLLINQLISVSMERKLLNQLHTFDFIPGDDRLVVERLVEMDKRIARIKSVIQSHTELMPTMTESELRQYTRRVQVEGELKAIEWLVAKRKLAR